jgi:hypothetical protein
MNEFFARALGLSRLTPFSLASALGGLFASLAAQKHSLRTLFEEAEMRLRGA